MDDLHIRDGFVVDGTGAPGRVADIAVRDGAITEVGDVAGRRRRTVDADGTLVTPGFVDIHTHFDGQVCWDKQVTPSSWHGVTTVVMGNCGVGFAPVRPGTEDELVALMEAVEDIPGTALHEGIPWGWETFGQYLDAIDTPYSVDVGAQIPHVALRYYVMGERCYDDATADDIARMADLSRARAGRRRARLLDLTLLRPPQQAGRGRARHPRQRRRDAGHRRGAPRQRSRDDGDHLRPHGRARGAGLDRGHRPRHRPPRDAAVRRAGRRRIWHLAGRLAAEGFEIRPQVGARPASVLMTLEGTLNPLRQFHTYSRSRTCPIAEQRAALRDPAFRAPAARRRAQGPPLRRHERDPLDVAPHVRAARRPQLRADLRRLARRHRRGPGVDVREVLMDVMADGRPILFLFGNYPGHLDDQVEAINHPQSVFGLSDGGAHCGVLCDASVPTYMLAYMTRDRPRGTMPLEHVVHKMTQDTARVYGMRDRGVLAPGYRADVNVIDYDGLRLHDPEMVYDLPAGGKRIIQRASGYRMTVCAGEVTYEDGEHTGAMPGRLVRGGR